MTTKKEIRYTSYPYNSDDGKITLYCFYPDGQWDEDKQGLEEAIATYPPSKFEWIVMNDASDFNELKALLPELNHRKKPAPHPNKKAKSGGVGWN